MKYKFRTPDKKGTLLERLLLARNIDCSHDDFLEPTFAKYRQDPSIFHDMERTVDRLLKAMKEKEKIVIFGDYDVDGITSSRIVFTFVTEFLGYPDISIKFPDRLTDGYGLKSYHLDQIKETGATVVITVDNGITSVAEAEHAMHIGLDLLVTDHHEPGKVVPAAYSVVNPKTSPLVDFKGICGACVAFKVVNAMMKKTTREDSKKKNIFEYFLPMVAIATVSDCVPLVKENRVIVKKGLEIINRRREVIPPSLAGLLDHLNIKWDLDTYHIGFQIGPRINAWGRIESPYDSLNALLHTGEQQKQYLDTIENINTQRRKLQEDALKVAEKIVDPDKYIIMASDASFHEGVVWIVAGRLTDKYYKPSMVLSIREHEGVAVGSLRSPSYFNTVKMIQSAGHLLERFGGHEQAWGLTVKLENLEALYAHFEKYAADSINELDLTKVLQIDTVLHPHEWDLGVLRQVEQLRPFGIGNEEPVLLFEDMVIKRISRMGKDEKHIKIHSDLNGQRCDIVFWSKGQEYYNDLSKATTVSIIGKIKPDSYNGGYFVDGMVMLPQA